MAEQSALFNDLIYLDVSLAESIVAQLDEGLVRTYIDESERNSVLESKDVHPYFLYWAYLAIFGAIFVGWNAMSGFFTTMFCRKFLVY